MDEATQATLMEEMQSATERARKNPDIKKRHRLIAEYWWDGIRQHFPLEEAHLAMRWAVEKIDEGLKETPDHDLNLVLWNCREILGKPMYPPPNVPIKDIAKRAVDALAPIGGQLPDPTPILQAALFETLTAEIAALPPEQRAERLERIKARAEESRKRNETLAKEFEAKQHAEQIARIEKEDEWRRRSFLWLLDPVPVWDEDTEEVAPINLGFTPQEVAAIREAAFEWESGAQRQKLPAYLFDRFSHMNADWESIVRWDNALALAFLYDRDAPEGAINVW